MSRPCMTFASFAAGALLFSGLSGCVTIHSDGFSLDKFTKPKLAKVQTNEDVQEAPPDPKHPERLKVAYARWMEGAGKPDEARKQYEAVLEKDPKNVEAILGIARIDQQAGHHKEAERQYKQAVETAPQSAPAQYGLGQFYAAEQRWSEALPCLKRAVDLAPDDTDSRYQYAVALAQTGKYQEALPHFIRTVGDAEAHYNVAMILKDQGRFEEAERHFLIAANKKPELVAARQWLESLKSQRSGGTIVPAAAAIASADRPTDLARDGAVPAGPEKNFDFPEQLPSRRERSGTEDRP